MKTALILTTEYMNLYRQIVSELETQGWRVTVVKDCFLDGDPKFNSSRLAKAAKRFIKFEKHRTWQARTEQFWREIMPSLEEHYNLFICLNAFTLSASVLEIIKKRTDRTVLYCWDICNMVDFSIISPCFDAAFTFDIRDSKRYSTLELLPNFYIEPIESRQIEDGGHKYSAMMAGAWRNERLNFLYALANRLDRQGKNNYFFKLIPSALPPLRKRLLQDYRLSRLLHAGQLPEFELKGPIDPQKYMEMMEQSEMIVDDAMPQQSGLTPRFIWGLARNKKIITTNRFALDYNFVAPENVCIVDRTKPQIPDDFITSAPVKNPEILSSLEIKNWVRIITGEASLPNY